MDPVILFSQLPAGNDVPEWLHLVPAATFSGVDGRGPYRMSDPAAVIRASLQMTAGRLPIDENHAIDRQAPLGNPSPARGWIVELESRADGLWGKVEWTGAGRSIVAGREYRGLSPALAVDAKGGVEVVAVLRASLTNTPNLSQLTTLHMRTDMDFIARLRQALGLGADVPEADVLAAVAAQKASIETHSAQLAAIRKAGGLADNLSADAIVVELQSRQAAGDQDAAKLRSTVVSLQAQLTTLQADGARDRAIRFIDDAIKAGKQIVALRDHYIERHMKDAAGVEKEIGAMVSLHAGRVVTPPAQKDGEVVLSAEEEQTCKLMGIDPKAFAESRKALKLEAL